MTIQERVVGSVTVLDLSGKLVLGDGDMLLKDKVHSLVFQGRKQIVLNMSAVSYVDSSGLGALVATSVTAKNNGSQIKLVGLTKRIQDLLSIAKLLTVFESYDTEADAISEGFGDYWAFTVSKAVAGPEFDEACIAKWDATSYEGPADGICLRRLDEDLMYPDDLTGEPHADGQIWSHALRNLHYAIGQAHADTAILMAQFDWTGTDMPDLAGRIVHAVHDLYGAGQAAAAQAAFAERGIL